MNFKEVYLVLRDSKCFKDFLCIIVLFVDNIKVKEPSNRLSNLFLNHYNILLKCIHPCSNHKEYIKLTPRDAM